MQVVYRLSLEGIWGPLALGSSHSWVCINATTSWIGYFFTVDLGLGQYSLNPF